MFFLIYLLGVVAFVVTAFLLVFTIAYIIANYFDDDDPPPGGAPVTLAYLLNGKHP